ncbi:hypothetical protein ABZ725_43310 [Streptomyces sp. NPDC006872]|uniref:hypothetical protein n=1 Tax=Streptomyces sp. NPDC006872 TaxID=3155720 RepID=UPI0033EDDFB6
MTATAVPDRIRRAVGSLDVRPDDRLLEIGCGGGVVVALICPLLTTGVIAAVDRSATARAVRRNEAAVTEGRAVIATTAFTEPGLRATGLTARRYDKIFAINVNLFWTGPATAELALAAKLLISSGSLYAFYDPPPGRLDEVAAKTTAAFETAGFRTDVRHVPPVVCVRGHGLRMRSER